MATLGQRIKALRADKGITQEQLAKELHISKSRIGMYEIDDREPNHQMMEAIADFFNVDMDYLYGRSEIKNEYQLSATNREKSVGVAELTTGQKIKALREELGLSQDELGRRLGYKSRSSINKIELDQRNLTQSKIKAIADALETTPAYIMGWNEEASADNVFRIETRKFPLLGNVACGEPIFADEERELYVEAGANITADFCLRAKGDSMVGARINDGDIVFIKKQDMVNNGEIAAVLIEDEATLKRVSYFPEKNLLILKAENPKYQDFIYTGEELNHIRILGRAVAFQSDVR